MSEKDIILKVENVSKLYRLGTVGTGTFGGDIQRFWKTRILGQEDPFIKIGQTNDRTSKEKADFVWALQDINFEVKRGEVLGIIGKNGAGKSTLLKLLSRITSPTTGSIKCAGRMASLLEVGTGFHPELTGRENIFLNGAILGMSKKEIQNKFDEIVDFSGCELYIDTPTKRYSSGMTVRLGFAVAAFLDPEILVVDEVLAVGDAEFQKKAIGKMKDVSSNGGRTVLFVSHNMAAVKNLCPKSILFSNGKLVFEGSTDDAINYYSTDLTNFLTNQSVTITNSHRKYSKDIVHDIEFLHAEFINKSINNCYSIEDPIEICLTVKAHKTISDFRVSCGVLTIYEQTVGTFFSKNPIDVEVGNVFKINIRINQHQLSKGKYFLNFSVGLGNELTGIKDFDIINNVVNFEILYYDSQRTKMINLWPKEWGSINFKNVDVVIEHHKISNQQK